MRSYERVHGKWPTLAPLSATTARAPSSTAGSSVSVPVSHSTSSGALAGRRTSVTTGTPSARSDAASARPIRPEPPARTTRPGRRASPAGSSGKRGLERDLDPRERLRDGAADLRLRGDAVEVLRRQPRHARRDVEVAARDPRPGWNVTDAVVEMEVGGVPFWPRACDSAMLKQDACAAAMSSSGVVTELDPSLRAFQLMSNVPRFEESNVTVPAPSASPPFHSVVASLVIAMGTSGVVGLHRCASRASLSAGPREWEGRARFRRRPGGCGR